MKAIVCREYGDPEDLVLDELPNPAPGPGEVVVKVRAAAGGPDKAYRDYIAGNMIGPPEALVEHHKIRKDMVGDYEMLANFSFGGLPYELVYEQLKLFADKVLPDLKC